MTVQAYVLVQTEVGTASQVATAIAQIDGVLTSQDVTGPYDVIAQVEGPSIDELGTLVVSKIQQTPGITRTLTCPVVRV
ncbi:MAG: Lrp/AsnC ligand binding domain-containing protein [Aeromicrobium sp.]|uniref:Lrp/AsnC family transcriptional regulator n=1 Tax=Aeromicrobium sp. TaxID=1871063 RepID=UPI0025BD7726|nr:Lrp/AsnC ligand binding domain-containing protein [Aeromicrobium sp.]MCK5892722.1 Lrp/AsnC ligand binding domain-containing protein [Aeromicrobium sp.]MDF1703617.1 Lrp/AsnC ligand binding domain-containing protein [Aeromicrobium sp.]